MIIKEKNRVIIFYSNPRREIALTYEEYSELENLIKNPLKMWSPNEKGQKMNKITFAGWIGKTMSIKDFEFNPDKLNCPEIYPTRGIKSDWAEDDWPPKAVRVTVETI